MTRAGVVALALLMTGCIPVVMSEGYLRQSRQNVPDEVPSFIETGRTTMADVVLALGEPDTVAANESWLAYVSRYRESGGGAVLLVGAGYTGGALGGVSEQMLYRRLIVRFDTVGTVTAAELDTRRCRDSDVVFGTSAFASPPCFDVESRDLVIQDIEQCLAAAGESSLVVYDRAEWLPTHEHGLLAVSDTAVHFVPKTGKGPLEPAGVRLALADVERAEVRQKNFGFGDAVRPQVLLLRGDAALGSFVLLAHAGDDILRTRDAGKLIRQRLEAAHR